MRARLVRIRIGFKSQVAARQLTRAILHSNPIRDVLEIATAQKIKSWKAEEPSLFTVIKQIKGERIKIITRKIERALARKIISDDQKYHINLMEMAGRYELLNILGTMEESEGEEGEESPIKRAYNADMKTVLTETEKETYYASNGQPSYLPKPVLIVGGEADTLAKAVGSSLSGKFTHVAKKLRKQRVSLVWESQQASNLSMNLIKETKLFFTSRATRAKEGNGNLDILEKTLQLNRYAVEDLSTSPTEMVTKIAGEDFTKISCFNMIPRSTRVPVKIFCFPSQSQYKPAGPSGL